MLRFLKCIGALRKFVMYLKELLLSKLQGINLVEQDDDENIKFNLSGLFKLLRTLIRCSGHLICILFYLLDDVVLLTQLRLMNPKII